MKSGEIITTAERTLLNTTTNRTQISSVVPTGGNALQYSATGYQDYSDQLMQIY